MSRLPVYHPASSCTKDVLAAVSRAQASCLAGDSKAAARMVEEIELLIADVIAEAFADAVSEFRPD
jgi:hypothetical protein